MGLLKTLLPWYRWTDRFGIRVISIPDFQGDAGVDFIVPPGFRIQPLSIIGQLLPALPLPKKYIVIEAHRGSATFFRTQTSTAFSGIVISNFAFAAGATREGAGANTDMHYGVLPTELYLLAGDRLHIHHTDPDRTDRYNDIVLTFKEWID